MLIDLSHQPPTIVLVTFEFEGEYAVSTTTSRCLAQLWTAIAVSLLSTTKNSRWLQREPAMSSWRISISVTCCTANAAERCVIAHRKAVANYNGGVMVSPCEPDITPQVHNVVGIRGYNQLGALRPKVDDLSADVLRTSFGDAQAEDPWSRLGMTSHLLLRQDRLARSANIRPDRQRKC